MKIVIAIPTILERENAWEDVARLWVERTPVGVICEPSWRKGGWAQGLNEVWEKHPVADVFVAASDDMEPLDGWYEAILGWLDKGIIAPQVHDPRFDRWDETTVEGSETRMSSFPILPCRALPAIFPIEAHEPQHYYADDLISDKARKAGIPTIAVPSCRIIHRFDERGRGAGMGSEEARMAYDRRIYRSLAR